MLNRAKPALRSICLNNPSMFEDIYNFSAECLDDMVMLYNTGKRHREAGRSKYTYLEFVANHPELQYNGDLSILPDTTYRIFVDMLYKPYCDGFDGVKR